MPPWLPSCEHADPRCRHLARARARIYVWGSLICEKTWPFLRQMAIRGSKLISRQALAQWQTNKHTKWQMGNILVDARNNLVYKGYSVYWIACGIHAKTENAPNKHRNKHANSLIGKHTDKQTWLDKCCNFPNNKNGCVILANAFAHTETEQLDKQTNKEIGTHRLTGRSSDIQAVWLAGSQTVRDALANGRNDIDLQ